MVPNAVQLHAIAYNLANFYDPSSAIIHPHYALS